MRIDKMTTKGKIALIFSQILPTNSIGKCTEISQKNSYVDIVLSFHLFSLLVVLEEAYGTPAQAAKKTDFRKLVKDLSRVRRLLQQVS